MAPQIKSPPAWVHDGKQKPYCSNLQSQPDAVKSQLATVTTCTPKEPSNARKRVGKDGKAYPARSTRKPKHEPHTDEAAKEDQYYDVIGGGIIKLNLEKRLISTKGNSRDLYKLKDTWVHSKPKDKIKFLKWIKV